MECEEKGWGVSNLWK